MAWRSSVIGPILVAMVSIFLMIRHTRSEEKKGRLELLNSTAVGRQAALASALITTCGANILMGVLIVLSFIGLGLPWEGSLAMALSMTAFGCLFAAIAGVAVQLTESSSDARYITVAILIAFFLLRTLGWDDGSVVWLSWISPLGWVHHIRAFAGEQWWIFGLFIVLTLVLFVLAYYLSSLRDLGAGILPQRTGPARASFALSSTLGLTWKLQRRMLIFWILGFVIMGIMGGIMAPTVSNIFIDNPQFMNLLSQLVKGAKPVDIFISLMLVLFGQVFAIYGILAVSKLRTEESTNHSEFLLTNAVNRTLWVFYNLFFAFIGLTILLFLFVLSFSISYSLISGDMGQDLPLLLSAALVYLPAILVMVGLTVALFGLIPRLTSLSWVALGLFFIINLLADFFDVNQWILNISPFTHVPNLLVGDTVGWPLILVLVVGLVLIFIGIVGFRRRDIV
ncbi:MAG: hypothetical protein QMD61_03945 [Methanobacterium sp.]|nr:hypothetical protein [Methanobacterium sp.]